MKMSAKTITLKCFYGSMEELLQQTAVNLSLSTNYKEMLKYIYFSNVLHEWNRFDGNIRFSATIF